MRVAASNGNKVENPRTAVHCDHEVVGAPLPLHCCPALDLNLLGHVARHEGLDEMQAAVVLQVCPAWGPAANKAVPKAAAKVSTLLHYGKQNTSQRI